MAKLKTGTRIYGSGIVDTTLLVGVTTLTGTANQNLQVTGGAYVSGNVGIGTTNAQVVLDVIGNSKIIGVLTATSFSGSGANLTSLNATQLTTGTVPDARLSGTYTGINVNTTGVITATSFSGSGTNLTSLNATQLTTGTVPDARLSGTYTGINVNTTGVITATSFSGSGTNLTSLNATQLTTGTVPDARLSGTYTGINVNTTGVITATSFSGSGAGLTSLNASNISSGTVAIARGGTNSTATPTNGGIAYGTGSAYAFTSAGNSGQVLTSNGASAPTWQAAAVSGVGIATASGLVGTGATRIDFRGSGISTVTVSSGIATVNITGGTGGGGSSVTLTDDTTTNATRYLLFDNITSGTLTEVNVSSSKLQFNPSSGTLSATVFTSLSDKTQKTNIRPISNAIEITKKLEGVRYDWIDNNQPSIGVIAQEIEKVLPEVVTTNDDGMMTVSYGNIVGLLIEAIKDQQKEIEIIKTELNQLKTQI